jgi:hypothetical protein
MCGRARHKFKNSNEIKYRMVECAVRYEPVSLLFGQKQGDFREKQREDYRKYEKAPETGHFSFF